jgi:hypothetical protein
MTLPGTTWYVRMLVSCFLASGFSRLSTVPFGSFSKALFVGAKTVNGPFSESFSAKPAAFTAATNVEKSLLDAAASTTVFGCLTG